MLVLSAVQVGAAIVVFCMFGGPSAAVMIEESLFGGLVGEQSLFPQATILK